MDIDDFKQVNDSYGHAVGDQVIQQVANVLKKNLRFSDAVVRLGGDEFAIIFPKTDIKKARSIAERFRLLIDDQCEYITVSVGVVEMGCDLSLAELIRFVDEMLYRAKLEKNSVSTMVVGL